MFSSSKLWFLCWTNCLLDMQVPTHKCYMLNFSSSFSSKTHSWWLSGCCVLTTWAEISASGPICTMQYEHSGPAQCSGNEWIPLLLNEDWHHCCSRHLFVFGHCIDLQQMNEWRVLVDWRWRCKYISYSPAVMQYITTLQYYSSNVNPITWLPIALGDGCPCCRVMLVGKCGCINSCVHIYLFYFEPHCQFAAYADWG